MPKFRNLLAAAVVIAGAVPAAAQVGSLSDGTLNMGQKVEQAPQPVGPAGANVEKMGDWNLVCPEDTTQQLPCRLVQLMNDDQGAPVSEITIVKFATPRGPAVAAANIIVPLETLLLEQLTISVDGENPTRYPFSYCNKVGCVVELGLAEADIEAMKTGGEANIVIVPAIAPDSVVNVNMSLSGFTAAYDKAAAAN
ncbi:invasion protein IalB [Shimia isoporae]|uniref:Invasion protein IalB n=1 Tax=Shimia isoporae TaxID=647720 RepID=A0A4R1NM89_9RHOB|nr:invasion associated locus B family protein [Shimia isoporae]TCL09424.1 invasion protein IalB [Shimia isoporae]